MREILFRGQTRRLGEKVWMNGEKVPSNWVYGGIFQGAGDFSVIYTYDPVDKYPVYSDTVGQFTGLTDKNGTKIFEGDIFKFPDEVWESYYTSCGTEYDSWETENYGVVGFSEYYGRYDFVQYKHNNNSVDADMHENNCLEFVDFISNLEVIGNIHDNPELLKGGVDNGT